MTTNQLAKQLVVIPGSEAYVAKASEYATQLGVDIAAVASLPESMDQVPFALICDASGISVVQTGPKAPGAVKVDFVTGAVAHRRRFGGGAGQQIAKAVGIKPGIRPRVADVTAGLGRDSFVLATLGCEVTLVERSAVIAMLLQDGLDRGVRDAEVYDILSRMSLVADEGVNYLNTQIGMEQAPEVVYLDPMFPHSNKSAEVKKEMRLFRLLIGDDTDTAELLAAALAAAKNRVVVKRPRKAPPISGPAPSFKIEGKSGRFDIYALKKLV
ncbi:MAG: class I SAM-dependent methyltransferase [Motiliproteus sp.]